MSRNRKLTTTVLLIAALMVSLAFYFYPRNANIGSTSSANHELSLVRPAFASDVTIMSTSLQQEAGMSIWLNATADSPLNLNAAKNTMGNNLENVTSDYVIGSIPLAGFTSDDYPHCFVHKSGWIIVYFLRINTQNPSTTGWLGKMMKLDDANYYILGNLKSNILQKGLEIICAGLVTITPTSDAKYYHFQYPNASKLMIAIKEAGNGQTVTFNIQVPSSFTIDERSWAYNSPGGDSTWKIDTTTIYTGSGRAYGGTEITSGVLSPDVWHTVTITAPSHYYGNWARVCILILYH